MIKHSRTLSWVPLLVTFLLFVPLWENSPLMAGTQSLLTPNGGGILTIPASRSTPKIDGLCLSAEYADAIILPWSDGGTAPNGKVFLMHNGGYLYACMQGIPGTFASRFGRLYLDPNGDGGSYTYAKENDYAMQVGITNQLTSSWHGSDVANGWVTDNAIPPFWEGAAFTGGAAAALESVEWRVSYGRLLITPCRTVFRLATYHHWFGGVGNDYGWPSENWFDQPNTWTPAMLQTESCGSVQGKIAYVYQGRSEDAISFYTLLTGRGYTVTMVPLSEVLTTNFSDFQAVLIADDTGFLDNWGTAADMAAQVEQIRKANRPIVGIGEGGYAFFGQMGLYIGWPHGWHGTNTLWTRAATAPATLYTNPYGVPDPTDTFLSSVGQVAIYLDPTSLPSDVISVALEPDKTHAPLIFQNCRFLWGGGGSPAAMSEPGKNLFINVIEYMKNFQCPPVEQPPSPDCFRLTKTANPLTTSTLAVGSTIEYELSYTYSKNCSALPRGIKLQDSIPGNTLYVPNSAGDGISPGADGSLIWNVVPDSTIQSKKFQVYVLDTVCRNNRRHSISNRANLLVPGLLPITSNIVTHTVSCPPLNFPNDQPPYAEKEVQIFPYPLIAGKTSKITVRLENSSADAIPVRVEFQSSPEKFGIGLNYSTFDSSNAILPASGTAVLVGYFTPIVSGHYCIQIKVSAVNSNYPPIYTQRNLDVTEELVPGVRDTLKFKVGNPTAATADIQLVVDNTCPGWSATVLPAVLAGMASGEVRDAALIVTPPTTGLFGSGCHIDVQAWIGRQLIGGIRKLDVPPVNLPQDVDPVWEEPEILLKPDPPEAGKTGQVCVFLQNPTGSSKKVSVLFQWADFGAGIGFTDIGTLELNLPANSADYYCLDWTPTRTGTLHRCIRVTLQVPGYRPLFSQRNVNMVTVPNCDLSSLNIPVLIGNPDLVTHKLQIVPTLIGILPTWSVRFLTAKGSLPPETIRPGEKLPLFLTFVPPTGAALPGAEASFFGDEHKVAVEVFLDGKSNGGFSILLDLPCLVTTTTTLKPTTTILPTTTTTTMRPSTTSTSTTIRPTSSTTTSSTTTTTIPTPQHFTLRISKEGTGSGTVKSTPSGIYCGPVCSYLYPIGTTVQLAAEPDPGSVFAMWGGDCEPSGKVLMNGDRICKAFFQAASTTTQIANPTTTTVQPNPTTTTTLPNLGYRLEFPHIAVSGGYRGFILLVNPTLFKVEGSSSFYRQDSTAMTLLVNGVLKNQHSFSIPPLGSLRVILEGNEAMPEVGWCRTLSNGKLSGLLIYQYLFGTEVISQATVLPADRMKRFRVVLPYLNAATDIGLAIANPLTQPVSIGIRYFSSDGIPGAGTSFTLAPGHQVARFIPQYLPTVPPVTDIGTVEFDADGEIIAVGLLFVNNYAVFTTVPIIPFP